MHDQIFGVHKDGRFAGTHASCTNSFLDTLQNLKKKTARTAFFTLGKNFPFRHEQTRFPAAYIGITRPFTRCKLTELPALR